LIEKGNFEAGKLLLLQNANFEEANSQTLCAALYLSVAYKALGEPNEAEKYIRFVDKNVEVLDLDEKVLYDRIKEKKRQPS